jgi:hypothetical protein
VKFLSTSGFRFDFCLFVSYYFAQGIRMRKQADFPVAIFFTLAIGVAVVYAVRLILVALG